MISVCRVPIPRRLTIGGSGAVGPLNSQGQSDLKGAHPVALRTCMQTCTCIRLHVCLSDHTCLLFFPFNNRTLFDKHSASTLSNSRRRIRVKSSHCATTNEIRVRFYNNECFECDDLSSLFERFHVCVAQLRTIG